MEGTHSLRDSNSRIKFLLSDKSKESDDIRIKREQQGNNNFFIQETQMDSTYRSHLDAWGQGYKTL